MALIFKLSPVQEMLSTPGPKYSMMDMVPPLTVRMPASLRILGADPAAELSCQLDTDHLGALELPGDVSHHVHSISTTYTNAETAQTSTIGGVRVCSDHQKSCKQNCCVLTINSKIKQV